MVRGISIQLDHGIIEKNDVNWVRAATEPSIHYILSGAEVTAAAAIAASDDGEIDEKKRQDYTSEQRQPQQVRDAEDILGGEVYSERGPKV